MAKQCSYSSSTSVSLFALFSLFLCVTPNVYAYGPPPGYQPITPNTCKLESQNNIGPKLPRPAMGSGMASSDLGSYPWFACTGIGSNRTCNVDMDYFSSIGSTLPDTVMNPPKGSLEQYALGVGSYAVFNIVLLVFIPLLTAFVIFCRYCTCCCCRPDRCTCVRCGTAWPTKRGSCGCGYGEIVKNDEHTYGYSTCSKVLTYLYMISFIIFGTAMILVAHFQGNVSLSTGLYNLVSGSSSVGTGIVNIVQSVIPPVITFITDLTADTIVPLLEGLNATLYNAINIKDTVDSLMCINTTLYNLPDVSVALTFLATLNNSLSTVKQGVYGLKADLVNLDHTKTYVSGNATLLSNALLSLDTNLQSTSTALTNAKTHANSMVTFQTTVADSSTGLLTLSENDLNSLVNNYPSDNNLKSAAGEASDTDTTTNYPTLNNILAGPVGTLNNQPSDIASLVTKLTGISTSLANIPSMTTLANRLDSLNIAIYGIQSNPGTLNTLISSLTALQSSLQNLPASSTFTQPIDDIMLAAGSVNIAPLATNLQSIANAVNNLPDFNIILNELDKVTGITGIIPCLFKLIDQIDTINSTVLVIPDSIAGATDMVYTANDTISTALSYVDLARDAIKSANSSVKTVDTSSYLSQIDSVNSTLYSQRSAFDVTALKSQLTSLDTQAALSFTSIQSDLGSLNTTLTSAIVPSSTIQDLRDFGTFLDLLKGNLTRLITDYTALAKGYCTADGSACTSNAQCTGGGGNTCTSIGTFRCMDSTHTVTEQAKSCAQDSDCAASAWCLADNGRAKVSKELLRAGIGGLPSVSSTISSIGSARTQANGVNVNTAITDIDGAISTINGLNTASYRSDVDGITNGFGGFDINAVQSTLDSTVTTIDSVSVDDYISTLSNMQDTLDMVTDYRSMLEDVINSADTVQHFLQVDLRYHLNNLSRPFMNSVYQTSGPSEVLRHVARLGDRVLTFARQEFSSYVEIPDIVIADQVNDYTPYVDKIVGHGTFARNAQSGPIHHLLSVAVPDMIVDSTNLPTGQGTPTYVFADSLGKAYADDKKCLTSDCLGTTMNAVNKDPITDLAYDFAGMVPDLPVPLSREQIFLIPWIFPVIVLLLAFWAVLAPACRCCCGICCTDPSWQKVPSSCMVGVIICQLPCILLITGLLFPFMLVLSDVCASGQNVGYNYVLSMQDGICAMAQGTGTATNCAWSVTLPSPINDQLNIDADIPALSRGLLGTCPSTDPFLQPFTEASNLAKSLPVARIIVLLDTTVKQMVQLRSGPRNLVIDAATHLGNALGDLLLHEHQSAMNCPKIGAVISEVKDGVCCGIVSPLYWYVSAWYMMALAMIFCGIPAGCLARKRLPRGLWGPSYKALIAEQDSGNGASLDTSIPVKSSSSKGKPAPLQLVDPAMNSSKSVTPRNAASTPPRTYSKSKNTLVLEDIENNPTNIGTLPASPSRNGVVGRGTNVTRQPSMRNPSAPVMGPTVAIGNTGYTNTNLTTGPLMSSRPPAYYDATHDIDHAVFDIANPQRYGNQPRISNIQPTVGNMNRLTYGAVPTTNASPGSIPIMITDSTPTGRAPRRITQSPMAGNNRGLL